MKKMVVVYIVIVLVCLTVLGIVIVRNRSVDKGVKIDIAPSNDIVTIQSDDYILEMHGCLIDGGMVRVLQSFKDFKDIDPEKFEAVMKENNLVFIEK